MNKELICCTIFTILTLLVILNLSPLNELFGVEPINGLDLIYLFLYSSLILAIMDTLKVLWRFFEYSKRCIIERTILTFQEHKQNLSG